MSWGTARVRPLIAAHRGGARLWPENSLTAFRGAIALGVDLLELDVHLTRDGEVVVVHDATLDRTTDGHGTVHERAWAELATASLKGSRGEALPRLSDVLEAVKPSSVGLLLEIKTDARGRRYPGMEEEVLARLRAAGLVDRTAVMAFEWETVERLRALSPTVRLTGLLSHAGTVPKGGLCAAAARLAAIRGDDLGIERTLLSVDSVSTARAAGLTIGVWTVNEDDELRRALAMGVDYVTTDRPDLALRLRAAR